MVLVLFGCAAFVEPQIRVGVVGSCPELGNWDVTKAVPLTPQQEIYGSYVPTCFLAKIELKRFNHVRFKFVQWSESPAHVRPIAPIDPFTLPKVEEECALGGDKRILFQPDDFELRIRIDPGLFPPGPNVKVVWEGDNSSDDRLLVRDGEDSLEKSTDAGGAGTKKNCDIPQHLSCVHHYDEKNLHLEKGETIYLLPIWEFLNPRSQIQDQTSEVSRTTRYYYRVKQLGTIHFQRVIRNIYVGSCPRKISHLELLKENYGVDLVINLQTHEDIVDNYISPTEPKELHDSAHLQRIYKQCKVSLVHLPTEDMCTPARAGLMAQTALIISAALVSKPNRSIYIHCNAGVGRAVATMCSFLRFAIGLSEAHTSTLVKMRRTVAFIDKIAMQEGYDDFQNKYAGVLQHLPLMPPIDQVTVAQKCSTKQH